MDNKYGVTGTLTAPDFQSIPVPGLPESLSVY